jgi:tRNA 2-thiouridine synthesizing protein B
MGKSMDDIESPRHSGSLEREVFLLTKPPHSERTKLCLGLVESSRNAILYLAGDGVYNLLSASLKALPKDRIFACKEDALARGIQLGEKATWLTDFYEHLAIDLQLEGNKIYVF